MYHRQSMSVSDKLHLYGQAMYLFNERLSYPQVKRYLLKIADEETATWITDKAEKKVWDKLMEKSRVLFSEGLLYGEVLDILKRAEEDAAIAKYAADVFYNLQLTGVHAAIDATTNAKSATSILPYAGIGFLVMLLFASHIWTKIIWGVFLLLTVLIYGISRLQLKRAKRIKKYFEVAKKEMAENGQQCNKRN
jgi:hypothetical protein